MSDVKSNSDWLELWAVRVKNWAPVAVQVCFSYICGLYPLKHLFRSQQNNSFVKYVWLSALIENQIFDLAIGTRETRVSFPIPTTTSRRFWGTQQILCKKKERIWGPNKKEKGQHVRSNRVYMWICAYGSFSKEWLHYANLEVILRSYFHLPAYLPTSLFPGITEWTCSCTFGSWTCQGCRFMFHSTLAVICWNGTQIPQCTARAQSPQ